MPTTNSSSHHFVTFTVDMQTYALPLTQVSRAVRMAALTQIPEAVPWIAGVVNIAGRITPVLDLRSRLGREGKAIDPSDRLLILDVRDRSIGLIVDEVSEVLEWPINQVESPPGALIQTHNHAQLLAGVIPHAEKLILVLDPGKLL